MAHLREHEDLDEAILSETDKFCLTNVKILGIKSKNKRIYPIETMKKYCHLYEGKAVYIGHDETNKGRRKYNERVGFVKNVKVKDGLGLYGDLQLNPHSPYAEQISWDWANNSKDVGLSQAAEGNLSGNVCTELTAVDSIDLVCSPASVSSLREEVEVDNNVLGDMQKRIEDTVNKLNELVESNKSLSESNKQLLNEVLELKSEKVVSYNPIPDAPKKEKVDLETWINKLKGKY